MLWDHLFVSRCEQAYIIQTVLSHKSPETALDSLFIYLLLCMDIFGINVAS